MIKILLASAALVVGTAGVATADPTPMTPHVYKTQKVRANGRCNGVSYGTGARRCGSLSGGPSGGNSSRN